VDVLTMSATPIPRTLHMSLVGVRDISNLETAPEERSAVETKVLRFNSKVIREAILRELSRGGQTYFVHNRVNDIRVIEERLRSIVPEASIIVGHGQMPTDELEDVMTDFIAGKYDILLATTIIESGLDIPNANTIFINEADRYGLSDLHQLRGRVGRYKHQAFCYLLLEPHKHLNPTAAKRLQAIETFSDMGAGFAISMRDLEIRGAGNLLGTQQSGHIATIGYELYCQLLEKAVRRLKHMPAKLSIHVEVDLPVAAFLPDEYVSDRRQKIDLYRRLTRLEKFEQIDELRDEIEDRFGPLPEPAERLMRLSRLKLEAALWQVTAIYLQDKYLTFKFQDRRRFEQLADGRKVLRVIDDQTALVTLKSAKIEPDKMLSLVKSLLQPAT
jgi:transcription-repair coupling factor (superfamily II helicase)